jgi:hypothetical protein
MKKTLRIVAVAGLALGVLSMGGCEFTENDPTGKPLTAQEWELREERVRRQAEDDNAKALRAKDAEVARVLAEAKAAEDGAKAEAALRRKRFEAAVSKVQASAGIEVAELASVYDQGEAESAARLAATVAALNARATEIDRATADRISNNAATIAEASEQTEAALTRIEAKQARIMGGLKLAEGAASTFGGPVGAALVSVLGTGGIGGLIFGASQRKKAQNIEAEKNRREATTKDIFLALEHIKGVDAEFKAKLKQHKEALNDWMGQDGIKLVNELTA